MWFGFVVGFVCGAGATIALMFLALWLSVRGVADLVMDETDVRKARAAAVREETEMLYWCPLKEKWFNFSTWIYEILFRWFRRAEAAAGMKLPMLSGTIWAPHADWVAVRTIVMSNTGRIRATGKRDGLLSEFAISHVDPDAQDALGAWKCELKGDPK